MCWEMTLRNGDELEGEGWGGSQEEAKQDVPSVSAWSPGNVCWEGGESTADVCYGAVDEFQD